MDQKDLCVGWGWRTMPQTTQQQLLQVIRVLQDQNVAVNIKQETIIGQGNMEGLKRKFPEPDSVL